MELLFALLFPLFAAPAVLYLLVTLGDAVVTAVEDWVSEHLRRGDD